MDYKKTNSIIDKTAAIYQNARINNSELLKNTIVGNFSRIDFSKLSSYCRIDRNNHLFHAKLDRYSYTGMNTIIMHAEIGAFCSLSWNVSIGGANHDYKRLAQHSFLYNNHDGLRPENETPPYNRFKDSIKIGNDVWIAAGAIITRGVTIGDGAVIGANSVVTKDVPPYAIVVGAPARLVKYRFEPDVIETLLKLNWWDWPIEKIKSNFNLLSNAPHPNILRELLKNDSI